MSGLSPSAYEAAAASCITADAAGALAVPNFPIIPYVEGDGIGSDIWKASVRVFDAAVAHCYGAQRRVVWRELLAGQKAFDATGEWLPEATLTAMRSHLVSIKGPLQTPVGGGIRSLNVAIRQALDLYVCQRPTRWFAGVPSPVRRPELVDMVIFRENTEDIYSGVEFAAGTAEAEKLIAFLQKELHVAYPFKEATAVGVKPVSRAGSQRLMRAALAFAVREGRKALAIVHKGNIMKFTEGAFKTWGYEVAEEEFGEQTYTMRQFEHTRASRGADAADAELEAARRAGKIIVGDVIADNFLQQILLNPEQFSVIATLNLNGDYVSDALAAIVGGIGIAPGANINYATGHAVFEATHGTAPRFANTNTMNPCSLILSGAMMFEYLGWTEVASVLTDALQKTILNKTVTIDFFAKMPDANLKTTSEIADCMIANMSGQGDAEVTEPTEAEGK